MNIWCTCILLIVSSVLVQEVRSCNLELKCISDGMCLISTSQSNFAIIRTRLSDKRWRAASINEPEATFITPKNKIFQRSARESPYTYKFKDKIEESNTDSFGFRFSSRESRNRRVFQVVNENNNNYNVIVSYGNGLSLFNGMRYQELGDLYIINAPKGGEDFVVWKDKLPFDWLRLLFIDNLIGIINKNCTVELVPKNTLIPKKLRAIEKLRKQVEKEISESNEY